jgi:hypothetical protein
MPDKEESWSLVFLWPGKLAITSADALHAKV